MVGEGSLGPGIDGASSGIATSPEAIQTSWSRNSMAEEKNGGGDQLMSEHIT